MPMYMAQFSYTREAWHDLIHNPKDRQAGVETMLEDMGGRLVGMYYCMGDHDGFIIYEAPDDESAGAGILVAVGTGHLKESKTTRLFSMEEALKIWAKAGAVSYAAPRDKLEEAAL